MSAYPQVFKSRYGKVTVYRHAAASGAARFKVYWRRGKRAFEEKYTDESLALSRAAEILKTIEDGDEALTKVDKEKLAYYVTCEEMLQGRTTLMDLVRKFMKEDSRFSASSLKEAVDLYIQAMQARGLSRAHMLPVISRLTRFVEQMPETLGEITVDKATQFLDQFQNLRTRSNERLTLNRFFNWCQAQGMLDASAPHVIARTDAPKPRWEEPDIIDPESMKKALWAAGKVYPEIVPAIALGGFGGLRRSEITRLHERDIDLGEGFITLSAKITKLNQRRMLPVNDTLRAWLEAFPVRGNMLADPSYSFKFRRCTKPLKLEWPANGLRHSYVSYRAQSAQDLNAVAMECGHSVETLQHSYRRLCTEAQAREWFSITPETCGLDLEQNEGVVRLESVDRPSTTL